MEEFLHINIFGTVVPTTVTASEEVVKKWIKERPQIRLGGLLPGLDIQPVHSVRPYPPFVATIQVCVDSEVLIYHMYNKSTLPPVLEGFITDSRHTFQCVNLRPEVSVLKYQTKFFGGISYINLAVLAAVRCYQTPLQNADVNELAFKVLGKEMPGEGNPDWDRPVLDTQQLTHACAGAYVAYLLGNELHSNTPLAAIFYETYFS